LSKSFVPSIVGGIFNTANPSVYEARKSKPVKAKVEYGSSDLQEWASAFGLQIAGPYDVDPAKRLKPFPVNR
jgi:hypothetical protein